MSNFNYEYYLNRYPELRQEGIDTYEKALEHWNRKGKYDFRLSSNIYNKLYESYMHNILFCISHHSTSIHDSKMLNICVESIREHYPNNDIIIVKTKQTEIHQDLYKYNITVIEKDDDTSCHWGCLREICKLPHKYFIYIHDSMFLLKKLPVSILNKKIYPLWNFYNLIVITEEIVNNYLEISNLNQLEKDKTRTLFNESFGKEWFGFFGNSFGGQIVYLKSMLYKINYNYNTQHLFSGKNNDGRNNHEYSERYLGLITNTLEYINKSDVNYSLNGNITDIWGVLHYNFDIEENQSLNSIKQYCKQYGIDSYFYKKLCYRIT